MTDSRYRELARRAFAGDSQARDILVNNPSLRTMYVIDAIAGMAIEPAPHEEYSMWALWDIDEDSFSAMQCARDIRDSASELYRLLVDAILERRNKDSMRALYDEIKPFLNNREQVRIKDLLDIWY